MKGGCLTLSVRQSLFFGGHACVPGQAMVRPGDCTSLKSRRGRLRTRTSDGGDGGGLGAFGEFCGKKCIIMRFW